MNIEKAGAGRAPTVEKATESIRDKIFMQEYRSGFLFTEALLAEEYGISRGSVRSALFVLEKEGLVATQPNGRKLVLGINERYINDLCEIRNLLECDAVRSCIVQRNLDYSRLAVSITEFYASGDVSPDDLYTRRARANTGFHRTLVEMAGNRPLMQCWDTIESSLTALAKINYITLGAKESESDLIISHTKLLEMIVKRDRGVIKELSAHILDAKQDSIDGLKGMGWI